MRHTQQELNKNMQRIREKNKKLQAAGIQLICGVDNKTNGIVLNGIEILGTTNGILEIEIPSEIDIIYNNQGLKPFIRNLQNKPVSYIRLINSNTKIEGYIGPLYRQDGLYTVDLQQFTFGNITNIQFLLSKLYSLKQVIFRNMSMKNIINTNNMFYDDWEIEEIDFRGTMLLNVETAAGMFGCCGKLRELHFPERAMKRCRNWQSTFKNCYKLGNWFLSEVRFDQAENLDDTFYQCRNIYVIKIRTDNDRSVPVQNVRGMVNNCRHLQILDVHRLNLDNTLQCEGFAGDTEIELGIVGSKQFNAFSKKYDRYAQDEVLDIHCDDWDSADSDIEARRCISRHFDRYRPREYGRYSSINC